MTISAKSTCFHCGLDAPKNINLSVIIDNQQRPMCCVGCQAVAQAIVDAGRADFYQQRDTFSETGQDVVPEFVKQLHAYDHPDIQKQFVVQTGEHDKETSLILEGIVCAACIWLNEQYIAALPGVREVRINYSTHRAFVRWDESEIKLSQILEAISHIGYKAHPYDAAQQQELFEKERKQSLRRLGLSVALGMQIMVFALALYTGDWWGIEPSIKQIFHKISLALTVPILLFCATPFWQSAWRDIKHRQLGMDVPISLGLIVSFLGSAYSIWKGQGAVYFDSISMFVTFILAVRYFEFMARKKTAESTEALLSLRPNTATRITPQGEEVVPVVELEVDDKVLILAGEVVPTDGVIIEGKSRADESLLTGESRALSKGMGDVLVGGSMNLDSPLQMRVTHIGQDTMLSTILNLLERAQSEKPKISQLADRIATRFVSVIVLLAIAVGLYYGIYINGFTSTNWIGIVVAVLVVTCPCALSLATPAAMTIAIGRLSQIGLLIRTKQALETLDQADYFAFDKTGTLTQGQLQFDSVVECQNIEKEQALAIATALEKSSEHPIAQAFLNHQDVDKSISVVHIENQVGAGLSGEVDGQRWYLGNTDYIAEQTGLVLSSKVSKLLENNNLQAATIICLANTQKAYAVFVLQDKIRTGAKVLIDNLQSIGKQIVLLSGDHKISAQLIAKQLGIAKQQVHAELKPEDKLSYLKTLQQQGAIVAMVGDGINDAPVLAGAQVSIAMGNGTQLAATSADMVLLNSDLKQLKQGIGIAQKTMRIIRQNLIWALVYNVVAVPLAVMGYVQPWLAAIGMSLSSLFVVLNALRLRRAK
jgi:Cu2+-exporting ATPase